MRCDDAANGAGIRGAKLGRQSLGRQAERDGRDGVEEEAKSN